MFLEIDGDETALLLVKVLFTDVACLKLVSGKVIHVNFFFWSTERNFLHQVN